LAGNEFDEFVFVDCDDVDDATKVKPQSDEGRQRRPVTTFRDVVRLTTEY